MTSESDDKSTQENMWQPISTMPDGAEALTRIKDASGERNVCRLRKQGRLFFKYSTDPEAAKPVERPRASAECPVCGVAEPHSHSQDDVNSWVNAQLSRWGYRAVLFVEASLQGPLDEVSEREWDAGYIACASDRDRASLHPASNHTINPHTVARRRGYPDLTEAEPASPPSQAADSDSDPGAVYRCKHVKAGDGGVVDGCGWQGARVQKCPSCGSNRFHRLAPASQVAQTPPRPETLCTPHQQVNCHECWLNGTLPSPERQPPRADKPDVLTVQALSALIHRALEHCDAADDDSYYALKYLADEADELERVQKEGK